MKVASACLQCRKGKRKCDRSVSGTACPQCLRRGIHCSSLTCQALNVTTLRPATDNSRLLEFDQLPAEETLAELIELYISYLHDKPHTLFHEPSLRTSANEGTLSKAVLFGIFGLAARLVEPFRTVDSPAF